jgi:hypothetical protein
MTAGALFPWKRPTSNNKRTMTMKPLLSALVVLLVLLDTPAADAQSSQGYASQPTRPPPFTFNPNDRGPPLPPDRTYLAPRSEIAPPMERAPPVAPLSPRIGE